MKTKLIYQEIAKKIISDIDTDVLAPGQKLPTEKDMCLRFGVSHLTVRKAFDFLRERNYVNRKQGVGTFVVDRSIDRTVQMDPSILIGVIVNNINISFLNEIVESISLEAEQHESTILLSLTEGSFSRERSHLETCIQNGVKRFILCPMGQDLNYYEDLKRRHELKMVFVDMSLGRGTIPTVCTDDVWGASQATRFLLGIGHTRILHVAGPPKFSTSEDRKRGYQNAMGNRDTTIIGSNFDFTSGYNAVYRFFVDNKNEFTAIFASNDLIAAGAKKAIEDLNLKVPEDVSILGYGNLDFSRFMGLSTVAQQPRLLGRLCVDALETNDNSNNTGGQPYIVKPELILRDSTMEK